MQKLKSILIRLSIFIIYQGIAASNAQPNSKPKRFVYGKVPGPLLSAIPPIRLSNNEYHFPSVPITRNGRLDRIQQKYDEGKITLEQALAAQDQLDEAPEKKQAQLTAQLRRELKEKEIRENQEIVRTVAKAKELKEAQEIRLEKAQQAHAAEIQRARLEAQARQEHERINFLRYTRQPTLDQQRSSMTSNFLKLDAQNDNPLCTVQ